MDHRNVIMGGEGCTTVFSIQLFIIIVGHVSWKLNYIGNQSVLPFANITSLYKYGARPLHSYKYVVPIIVLCSQNDPFFTDFLS